MAPVHVYLKVDPILWTVAKKHAFPNLVATPSNSDHLRPIQLEPAGIWTVGPPLLTRYFCQKCFLASQVGISSQNQQQSGTAQTLATDGRRDQIGRFLKTP